MKKIVSLVLFFIFGVFSSFNLYADSIGFFDKNKLTLCVNETLLLSGCYWLASGSSSCKKIASMYVKHFANYATTSNYNTLKEVMKKYYGLCYSICYDVKTGNVDRASKAIVDFTYICIDRSEFK